MKHRIYSVVFLLCCLLPFVGYAQKKSAYADAVRTAANWKPPVQQTTGKLQGDVQKAVPVAATGKKAVDISRKLNAERSSVIKVDAFKMLKVESERMAAVKSGKFAASSEASAVRKAPARAAQAIEVKPGFYISKDNSLYDGEMNAAMELFADTVGEQIVWKMINVYGVTDSVTINIDTAAGTVSIDPQKIGTSSTYGDVWIYKIDPETNKYFKDQPITGTMDAKGVITLGPWAVMVGEGEHAGAIFNAFSSSQWLPSNATVKVVKIVDGESVEEKYPSYIDQKYDNEVVIHNFANYGTAIYATLTPSKTLRISPQAVLTNIMYGDFCIYPVDLTTNKIDTKTPVAGTVTETADGVEIALGSFVISQKILPTAVLQIAKSTQISSAQKLRYPEPLNVAFEGAGTEASPYLGSM